MSIKRSRAAGSKRKLSFAVDHRKRHIELHHALDELVADWIGHHMHGDKGISNTPIIELMRWSHEQTIKPILLPSQDD